VQIGFDERVKVFFDVVKHPIFGDSSSLSDPSFELVKRDVLVSELGEQVLVTVWKRVFKLTLSELFKPVEFVLKDRSD